MTCAPSSASTGRSSRGTSRASCTTSSRRQRAVPRATGAAAVNASDELPGLWRSLNRRRFTRPSSRARISARALVVVALVAVGVYCLDQYRQTPDRLQPEGGGAGSGPGRAAAVPLRQELGRRLLPRERATPGSSPSPRSCVTVSSSGSPVASARRAGRCCSGCCSAAPPAT